MNVCILLDVCISPRIHAVTVETRILSKQGYEHTGVGETGVVESSVLAKRMAVYRELTHSLSLFPRCSTCERAGHHKVLPHVVQAWRLGLGPELRHHRAQQPLFSATLHR